MERKMEGKCNHLTPIGIAITKKQTSRAWWLTTQIPAILLGRFKGQDFKFKDSPGNEARSCLKIKFKNKKKMCMWGEGIKTLA
jgi:hypothetical protein